jgi:nicotinamide phosphoribosyltransferase
VADVDLSALSIHKETCSNADIKERMKMLNPLFNTDGYKLDHRRQYPAGTEKVYSNWTARGSRINGVGQVIFLGLQYAIKKHLMEDFDAFFAADVDDVCNEYQAMLDRYLGPNEIGTEHVRALHDLGYLPLEFKALPEGTRVPLRVPMFTVENTHPDFFWLVNYFETILSATLWMPSTSATNAMRIRELLDSWASKVGAPAEGVAFQGHDFSMRGMSGLESACLSGMGHLTAFTGTETVPVLEFIDKYYPTDEFLAGTVPATEHSVMCAGGEDDELATYSRLLDLYPAGILSVVSDTWDLWKVLTETLPTLKDKIMARDGKLVIRPDSGDPADIICGLPSGGSWNLDSDDNPVWIPEYRTFGEGETPEAKGVYELLWDLFGGTVNDKGYKVLDPHIGVIYGDAMNYDRINDICSRLEAKGFSMESLVFGLGSYGYQYQTRDTFGFAMKATNVVINGIEKPIFKDPVTDSGTKKSLKGRIAVLPNLETGELYAVDNASDWALQKSLLTTVWKDGKFVKRLGFEEVRSNARR